MSDPQVFSYFTQEQKPANYLVKMKKRCKLFSKFFGKRKSVAIKKVEYAKYGCAVQVTLQQLIEKYIMKEISHRFILA